ncbi:hypothetical protein KKE06_00360 [Candidatus Micrarchaeota archaeon]|nr:hypothetical protein [Candidatus Micrarchaeota archaeon]MBU1930498.1 hypothetical protein [Candidatus Micrarchaeota archaeon]
MGGVAKRPNRVRASIRNAWDGAHDFLFRKRIVREQGIQRLSMELKSLTIARDRIEKTKRQVFFELFGINEALRLLKKEEPTEQKRARKKVLEKRKKTFATAHSELSAQTVHWSDQISKTEEAIAKLRAEKEE